MIVKLKRDAEKSACESMKTLNVVALAGVIEQRKVVKLLQCIASEAMPYKSSDNDNKTALSQNLKQTFISLSQKSFTLCPESQEQNTTENPRFSSLQ